MHVTDKNECKLWRETHGYKQRAWSQHATCITPLSNLDWFVKEILSALGKLDEAGMMVSSVLSTTRLSKFRGSCCVSSSVGDSPFHIVTVHEEIESLLFSAFSDPVDFSFFPVPKRFVLTADHDEYTTFFGMSKSSINKIVVPLKRGNVTFVEYEPEHP